RAVRDRGHRQPLLARRRGRGSRRLRRRAGRGPARALAAGALGLARRPAGRGRRLGRSAPRRASYAIRSPAVSEPPPATGSRSAQAWRAYARNRLIESRLTPNAISMTGLVLNAAAAALVVAEHFVLAGVAFIVGSIMDTLDGRYSRMSGKG